MTTTRALLLERARELKACGERVCARMAAKA
jgi:hypothetical protein